MRSFPWNCSPWDAMDQRSVGQTFVGWIDGSFPWDLFPWVHCPWIRLWNFQSLLKVLKALDSDEWLVTPLADPQRIAYIACVARIRTFIHTGQAPLTVRPYLNYSSLFICRFTFLFRTYAPSEQDSVL